MKNTTTKILILATALIVAIGAVLYFIKTVVDPPVTIEQRNLHAEAIDAAVSSFNSLNKSKNFDDSLYVAVNNKITLFHAEEYISDAQKDVATNNLVQAYLPLFKSDCYNKFNASKWNEKDHTKMTSRIKELRDLRVNYGNRRAVSGSYETDLQNIETIIQNYKDAKNAARKSSYSSVNQAKTDIDNANRYITMPYISNCTDLVNKLRNVKVNISNSHYQYLTNQVYSLADYRSYTKDSYTKLVNEVLSKLESYVSMKSVYGSAYKDISTLKKKVGEYELEANEYFTRPEITVNTNSLSWYTTASPHSGYNAYQSSSNYHKSNTDSRMSFTIKGYSSFTFYIRSNGESTYDYVMVGLPNTVPTRSNNYKNTSGKQNSSSQFYSYTPVTFSNLSKSSSYTIYVVYTKDSSNNHGDDRGYVLIPKL